MGESYGKPIHDASNKIIGLRGVFQDIDEQKKSQLEIEKNEALLESTGQMAKIGGWEVDFKTMTGTWSKQVTLIHEMPLGYQPKLEEALQFVHPDYIAKIQEAMGLVMTEGKPFDEELKIITAHKREVWVRAIGVPVFDEQSGEVVATRGVFQDIDERKEKELALQTSFKLINEQNQRLVNFANIVSHNLKSHAANLELTLSLMELETDPQELEQLRTNLTKISKSFNETVEHLKDIVVIQSESHPMKVALKFETFLLRVMATLHTQINRANASIDYDFSQCPDIEYIPAYLESILLNLISNAIKYRKPDTDPKINIHTYRKDGRIVLEVSDNGLGIDMDKNGHQVFGMYKTFHHNPNAKGIGLFITRNQIEALGGSISVSSKVGEGCTFKIIF